MHVSKEQELLNILALWRGRACFFSMECNLDRLTKTNSWSYLSQPTAEWKPIVPGKTPYLSACSGNLTDNSKDQGDDYHRNHNICSYVAVRDIVEELDEGIAGRAAEETFGVGNGKAKRQDDDEAENGVEENPPQYRTWKGLGGILDFFCCWVTISYQPGYIYVKLSGYGVMEMKVMGSRTHVHRTIKSKHAPQRSQQSNHKWHTHRWPTAAVCKF